MNMNTTSLLIALCLLIQFGCSDKSENEVVHRTGEPDYIRLGDDADKLMDSAIAEAQSTLPMFEHALAVGGTNCTDFTIKKGFSYGAENGQEHIWIIDVTMTNGGFEGFINNEPVDAIYLKLGQKVFVSKNEISDWMYFDDGKLRGGYTIVALTYGTDEQAHYETEMGIDWSQYKFLNNGSNQRINPTSTGAQSSRQ